LAVAVLVFIAASVGITLLLNLRLHSHVDGPHVANLSPKAHTPMDGEDELLDNDAVGVAITPPVRTPPIPAAAAAAASSAAAAVTVPSQARPAVSTAKTRAVSVRTTARMEALSTSLRRRGLVLTSPCLGNDAKRVYEAAAALQIAADSWLLVCETVFRTLNMSDASDALGLYACTYACWVMAM
jgi:hypothetical protein